MRRAIFWISSIAVLAALNGMVAQKEAVLASGRTILLELIPVDPRSLMQGDYMALRWKLEQEAPATAPSGTLTIRVDSSGVGHFAGVSQGGALSTDEVRLRYSNDAPTRSFFFQEGQGAAYAGARYGELRVSPDGSSVLTGLRDDRLRLLKP